MWISAKRTAPDDVALPSKPRMLDGSVYPSAPGPRESDPRQPCCYFPLPRSWFAVRTHDVVVCAQGADRARSPVRADAPLMGASVRTQLVTPLIENQKSAAA